MSRVERGLWAFGLLVLILHVAGAFAAGPNVWGIHHYAFLPKSLLWIAAGLAFLLFIPPVGAAVARALEPPARSLESPGFARVAGAITIAILAVLFFVFRQRIFLLSDGMLLIRSVTQGFVNFTADTLAAVIQLWFHYGLEKLFGVTSNTASFRIVSIGCGMIWLAAMFLTVGRLSKDGPGRFILAGLLATLGVTKLFYGYVETGPLLTAAIGVYVWTAVRLVQDGRGIVAATFAFLAVAALHVTGLLLFPSYLFLLLRWSAGDRSRLVRAIPLLLLPVIAYMAYWFSGGGSTATIWAAYRPYFGEFIPLSGPLDAKQAFTLFSLPRLTEFLNEQMFIGPFALLALIVVMAAGGAGSREASPARRFFVWVLAPFLLLSLVFNRKLGGARDWDLLANLAVPATFLVGLALLESRKRPGLSPAGLALIGASALHLFGLVFVDARPETSIERFITVFDAKAPVSRFARSYAVEEVGQYYVDQGHGDLAVPFFEEAANADPGNVKALGTLGTIYMALGRRDDALPLLEKAVNQRPEMAMNHYNLAAAYAAAGRWTEAAASFAGAVERNRDLLPAYAGWGTSLNQMGRSDLADSVARAGLERYPDDPDLLVIRGNALERLGRPAEALEAYRRLLAKEPDNTRALFNASRLELDSRRFEAAVSDLERLTRLDTRDAEAVVNLGIAYLNLKKEEDAIATFRKAIEIDPKLPQPYVNLATIYQQKGDLKEAVRFLEAYAKVDTAAARVLGLDAIIEQFRSGG